MDERGTGGVVGLQNEEEDRLLRSRRECPACLSSLARPVFEQAAL